MTDPDWKALESAFKRAAALQGDARATFLAAFAEAHPALVEQLESLLAADAGADAAIRGPIATTVESMLSHTEDPWIGRQLGPWTIRKRLVQGGMGAVFLADRADLEYVQEAALKVMSAQLHSPSAIARFKAERQILADLNHPNIARLLDGGSTDDGAPFLVMEYIDGLPIDRYCEAHALSVEARLRLMRKVCEAVDYAHRHLIIHRDLKPSNILVDENGEPKLLDFGIAKLLEPGDYDVAVTRQGTRAMTPEYASPEQVRGEAVSTATDVYALGVLLFRLMTGQSPYGRTATSAREFEQAIMEEDPYKPSTIVTSTEASGIGSVPPEKLRRLLSGDLDNIVLKALQKEPARRYPTALALSEDLRRYLGHEPVEARGEDRLYRLGKFLRRRAQLVASVATVVVTIVVLVAFYTVRLADERDRANAAATEAREVAAFLTTLFESASPHATQGEAITAVDLLEDGRERIEALDTQPKVQAELMRIMAASMTALGYWDRSIPMLHRVLEMQEAQQPPDRVSISLTTNNLAEAYRQVGELDRAEDYLRQTLEIARAEFGPTDSNVAYLTARLGVLQFDAYHTEDALENERRALEIFINNGDGETSGAIDARGNMANALARLGRYEEAETLHRQTVALSERVDGERHPNTIIRKGNLSLVLTDLGKLDEAIANIEETLGRMPGVWPDGYDQFGWTRRIYARPLALEARFAEALEQSYIAVDIMRANHGETSTIYANRLLELGRILLLAARYDEAATILHDALGISVAEQGDDGPLATLVRIDLARLDIRQGRHAEAESKLRRVLLAADRLGHAQQMAANTLLATALSLQGDYAEADRLLAGVFAATDAVPGGSKRLLLVALGAATAHYRRSGNLDAALESGNRIARLLARNPTLFTWQGALALAEHGLTLQALGDPEAGPVLGRAMTTLLQTLGPADPRVRALQRETG